MENNIIEIVVKDTGMGMTKETAMSLFELCQI